MHIEPVLNDFDYVTIRRTGGIMGANQRLHIDKDLTASIQDRHVGDRVLDLDAFTAHDLMVALSHLIERNPGPSTARGADFFHYDVEIACGGVVHTFHSVDLGADEALQGVMIAANNLLANPQPIHAMTMHATPITAASAL